MTVVQAPKRTHIEVLDSNKDGIPNWQDELRENEPLVLNEATSTPYEAPESLTGTFALRFFEDAVRAQNYGAFGMTNEELVAEATQTLAEEAQDELYTEADLTIDPNTDPLTLKAYGNAVAAIILSQSNTSDSEAVILQDVLRYNDPQRLQDLEPIAQSYDIMVTGMLALSVPQSYSEEHLNLVNALSAIREDIRGMQLLYEDPLYTLLRMKRYEDDALGLSNAVLNLFNTLYLEDSIHWNEHEPAAQLIRFES